jgi:hypothetical protein
VRPTKSDKLLLRIAALGENKFCGAFVMLLFLLRRDFAMT